MADERVTEEELRQVCLDAASRGEPVGHILDEYLRASFLHEHEEADRAATHRSDEAPDEWWTAAGARPPEGRHRAVS
ncbi:hypothetical protein [Ornithinimicrobium cryptoxanthini]|uniref:Uncharacterized protein n=1 Tax=Ornithinimicrobium cryptoxanthini TaxID=2934161 RepID=A0ABY4YKD3_9MICO|nr:hypothetical protein [Ornithinimicrobium cryptoxanthini]USQ77074.1 hypothetical protein NF557_03915 [Ornithinimicrobium cryptoxanthini]